MLTETYPQTADPAARAARLARLAADSGIDTPLLDLVDAPTRVPQAVTVALTGATVYAGGAVPRVLIRRTPLTWQDEDRRPAFAFANLGDVVLVSQDFADRGTANGSLMAQDRYDTIAPDGAMTVARTDARLLAPEIRSWSDPELATMRVNQLILLLASADEPLRARIQNVEESRRDGGRPTVLSSLRAAEIPVAD